MEEYRGYVEKNILTMRNSLLKKDEETYAIQKSWLMGEIVAVLMMQDKKRMMILRGRLADMIPLADEFGGVGAGERWRATWEILRAFCNSHRPLEQLKLSSNKTMSGRLLRAINKEPGLSGAELSVLMNENLEKINDAIASLLNQDLIMHIPDKGLYVTETGREILSKF